MDAPLFSVVLPSHNRASLLRPAVRSVLRQDCADFELLVVDDGSTDSTPELAREFSADPRVVWTRLEANQGQHVARNHALRRAQGRFVTFLDSDDIYLPRRLFAFREAMLRRPSVSFWFSNAYLLRGRRVVGRVFDPGRSIPEGRVPGWYAVGDSHLPYLTSNLALRRELFQGAGLYREDMRILEDTELYARMLRAGAEVGALRECLAVRRLHGGQITRDYLCAYEESLEALRAGGAPPEVEERRRRELARAVALYLVKELRPDMARAWLERAGIRSPFLRLLARSPVALLRPLKTLRGLWLDLGLASRPDFWRAERWVADLEKVQSPPGRADSA